MVQKANPKVCGDPASLGDKYETVKESEQEKEREISASKRMLLWMCLIYGVVSLEKGDYR